MEEWKSKFGIIFPALAATTIILILAFFYIAISSSNRPFPTTDEWSYIVAAGNPSTTLSYLFTQHNDHRIPLQKLLHLTTLHLGGYDFRPLVMINMLIAGVTALVLMYAARSYRGHWSVGDLALPFICLNFGFGMSLMGFELQFLSSVLFTSLLLLAILKSEGGQRSLHMYLAAFWAFLLAWTGLNGVIVGTLLSISILAFSAFGRSTIFIKSRHRVAMLFALLMNIGQLIFWHPSSASQGMAPIPEIVTYFHGLFVSAYPVYATMGAKYITPFFSVMLVLGSALGIRQLLRKGDNLATYTLLSVVAATFALLASVAYGRAQVSAWGAGADMHYGILSILTPTALWILLSKLGGRYVSTLIGVAFLVLSVKAFIFSAQWRMEYVETSGPSFRATQAAIASNAEARSVANSNLGNFFYGDTPEIRDLVTSGVSTLRAIGGWEYHTK